MGQRSWCLLPLLLHAEPGKAAFLPREMCSCVLVQILLVYGWKNWFSRGQERLVSLTGVPAFFNAAAWKNNV